MSESMADFEKEIDESLKTLNVVENEGEAPEEETGFNAWDKKLTINDIAKMSGVAKSTVSRYLNGGSVRPSTGQKIKKIIEENNYEPNVFARLKAKESRVIGLTVPGFDSVTTPRLVEVIVEYLKKNDYTPLIMHTGNKITDKLLQNLFFQYILQFYIQHYNHHL